MRDWIGGHVVPALSAPGSRLVGGLSPANFGDQRGNHLMQVACHAVVGTPEEGGISVLVNYQNVFRGLTTDQVLDRAADPTRDVQFGCDAVSGESNLDRMRAPAIVCCHSRAAHCATQHGREFLQDTKPLGAPYTSPASDHNPSRLQVDTCRISFLSRNHSDPQILLLDCRHNDLDRCARSIADFDRLESEKGDSKDSWLPVKGRLLE